MGSVEAATARAPGDERQLWQVAIAACLVFVASRYFYPDFLDNEFIYSLTPIKLLNPGFLPRDQFLDRVYPFFLYFDGLTAPLYALLGYLPAVLLLRLLIWWFQVWALSRLARTLGLKWWGFALLFVLWMNVEQTLVAGDWIIRSANSKPVAYGFVFLALDSLLNGRHRAAGIFGGLATVMHVIVGFWANAALFLALALTGPRLGRLARLKQYLVPAGIVSAVGLLPPLYGEVLNGGQKLAEGSSFEIARWSVLLANPFHLDPDHFMTGYETVKVAVFFTVTLLALRYLVKPGISRAMAWFAGFLCLFFVSGLVARRLEWYWYLKYYPFRLADSFVPLFFWMTFVLAFQGAAQRLGRRGILLVFTVPLTIGVANYLVDRCEDQPGYELSLASFTKAMLWTEPRMTLSHLKEKVVDWRRFLGDAQPDDAEEMYRWIRGNTPENALFISLPWDMSFSLKARRSEFVAIKPPPNARIYDWMKKISLVNGGPLQTVGFAVYAELKKNYPRLTGEEVGKIASDNNVDFFLTNAEKAYDFPLVHSNATLRLYDLRRRG